MEWKYFEFREIDEALEWAKAGNVAVHNTGFPFRQYKETAHLFCADLDSLLKAAKSVNVQLKWIQIKKTDRRGYFVTHFDLMGKCLQIAKQKCQSPTIICP